MCGRDKNFSKYFSALKNRNDTHMQKPMNYGHMLSIIKNKYHRNQRGKSMMNYNDLSARNKKGVKMQPIVLFSP